MLIYAAAAATLIFICSNYIDATIMQFHVFTRVIGRKAQSKGACRFSCRRKVTNLIVLFTCEFRSTHLLNVDSCFSSSVLWKSQWPAVMSTLIPTHPPWQAVILLGNMYLLAHQRAVIIATKVVATRTSLVPIFQFMQRVPMRWMTYREMMTTSRTVGTAV